MLKGGIFMTILEKLRLILKQQDVEAFIVMSDQNRRYLTNFTGSEGAVLVTQTEAKLFVDFRYTEQATAQCPDFTVQEINPRHVYDVINASLKEQNITTLAFEEQHVSFATYRMLTANIKATLQPMSLLVEAIRLTKTPDEIELIKKAAWISDEAFTHILTFIKPGVTEREIAFELESHMRKNGADGASFDMIVASGTRSALPHGAPTEKKIETGDMLTLDFGAYYKGYRSDMTRTIAVGEPPAELRKIYDIVLAAQELSLKEMKIGMTAQEVDSLSRDYITAQGYGAQYGHGAGHGIGLDIHEDIFLAQGVATPVRENMVLTMEPGIYIPGLGGVRIEDDVIMTKDGAEVITHSPKELIVL